MEIKFKLFEYYRKKMRTLSSDISRCGMAW